MNPNAKHYWLAVLLLSAAQIIWSGNFIAGRMLASAIEPFTLVILRWSLSLGALFLVAHRTIIADLARAKERWPMIVLTGILGTSLFPALLYTGLQGSEALNASLFFSSAPVVVLLLSALIFREAVSLKQGLGVTIGILGVMIIAFQGSIDRLLAFNFRLSDLWVFGALTTWSVYCILQPKVAKGLKAETVIFVFALAGMPLNIIGFGFEYHTSGWPDLNLNQWIAIIYIAFFPSLTAYFLWNGGQNRIGAAQASPFNHVAPVSAAILGYAFLGEPLHLYHFVAALFIIGGVLIFTRK